MREELPLWDQGDYMTPLTVRGNQLAPSSKDPLASPFGVALNTTPCWNQILDLLSAFWLFHSVAS